MNDSARIYELSELSGQLEDLAEACRQLGPDELQILTLIAKRLVMGRRAYGRLDVTGDRRDWRREASEELLDSAVYLAAETLRRT